MFSKVTYQVGETLLKPIHKALELCKTDVATPPEITGAVASDILNDESSQSGYLSKALIQYVGMTALLVLIPLLLLFILPKVLKPKRKRRYKRRRKTTTKRRTYKRRRRYKRR